MSISSGNRLVRKRRVIGESVFIPHTAYGPLNKLAYIQGYDNFARPPRRNNHLYQSVFAKTDTIPVNVFAQEDWKTSPLSNENWKTVPKFPKK